MGEIHKANEGIPTAVIGVCKIYTQHGCSFDIRDYYSARQLLKECITHLNHHQIEVLKFG